MPTIPAELAPLVPIDTEPKSVEAALASLQCAAGGRGVTYLSVPVTTGPLFVSWFRTTGKSLRNHPDYRAKHVADVIEPNVARSKENAEATRVAFPESMVVNPALLSVNGWGQGDYLRLWLRFICASATRVVASEGWQFSFGCTLELATSVLRGIPTFAVTGAPVTIDEMRLALEASIHQMREAEIPTVAFETVESVLRQRGARHLAPVTPAV
jgi:hypothetical protein